MGTCYVSRGLGIFCAFLMPVAAAGCGGDKTEFGDVEGRVTRDGEPLADVLVEFHPDPAQGTVGNSALACTDANGWYRLQTPKDDRPGAVVGVHRVVFTDGAAISPPAPKPRADGAKSAGAGKEDGKPRAARFGPAYADTEKTPYRSVEVRPGKQTQDFDLKSVEPPR